MRKTASTFIIAEAGVNHNGSVDIAKKLIDKAVCAGVDAIKFQTFKADEITTKGASKASYQMLSTNKEETQLEMLHKLEISYEEFASISEYCKYRGIQFLSSPFDIVSAKFLCDELGLSVIKIPSGEITNVQFLHELALLDRKLILSTGMSSMGEIENALAILVHSFVNKTFPKSLDKALCCYSSDEALAVLKEKVILLHCNSQYPTPFQDANLFTMKSLQECYGLPVGLSDHTEGTSIPLAAVALGAVVIEKHFTLDRHMQGPDHKASIIPEELALMVKSIREVELSLGSSKKRITNSERDNRKVIRRSLVAAKAIKKGELFSLENLTAKRPGNGIVPMNLWSLLDTTSTRDYQKGELL